MKTITIGRSSSCDIVIANDAISRIHAEISVSGNQYAFKDVSKNGSTINGQYLNNTKIVVSPGSNILLSNKIPLPWSQIYAMLPLNNVQPYDSDTKIAPISPIQHEYAGHKEEDVLGIGWAILAFLIPLAGWIMYFCWNDRTPNRASKAAGCAWAGFGLNVLMSLISVI